MIVLDGIEVHSGVLASLSCRVMHLINEMPCSWGWIPRLAVCQAEVAFKCELEEEISDASKSNNQSLVVTANSIKDVNSVTLQVGCCYWKEPGGVNNQLPIKLPLAIVGLELC